MTNRRSPVLGLGAIVLALTIAGAGVASAAVADIAIDPPNPSSSDSVSIGVSGVFTSTCVPKNPVPTVGPGTITIATTNTDLICLPNATGYTLPDVDVGTLAPGLYCVTVTYTHAGPPSNLAEKCFTVADIAAFRGTASQVGKAALPDQAGGAGISINGKFSIGSGVALDLSTSTVKLTGVLTENGDELAEGINGANLVPVQLAPRHQAYTDRAVFATSGTLRPAVRMALRLLPNGLYAFQVRVSRATIPHSAAACQTGPTANLITSFEITDSVSGNTVQISTRNGWQCGRATLRTSRSAGSSGSSSNRCPDPGSGTPPAGDPPRAALRTNLLTRDTGQPNLVELDASGTTAGDGTLSTYRFTVFHAGACGVAYGPVQGSSAKIQVTLPPGEYVGSVIVKDSLGSESEAGQRGFSTP